MATTKKAAKKVAKKPLSDRAWKKLTTRQKKAEDLKRYNVEVKAEAKAKELAKKAAAKEKEAAKIKAMDEKYIFTSSVSGKKVGAKYALANPDTTYKRLRSSKTVSKKTTAKKTASKSSVKKAIAKAKTVVDKAIEKAKVSVRKPAKKSARSVIDAVKMVSGLDGSAKTYVVIAEKPKGSTEKKIAVRYVGREYRVHAFPDFKSHGIDAPMYTNGTIRPPRGDRGQYQTQWVGLTEFKGFLVKLGESEDHAHLAAKLLAEKFGEKVLQEATA